MVRDSLALTAIVGAAALFLAGAPASARDSSYSEIQKGLYLTYAGDCSACHTAEGGQPFAGGRAIPTPFGTIYSTNITPDPDTGIGNWSDDDFYRTMHEGIDPDGKHLYPAFPYPWFTLLSREDVRAIKSFLDTLQPVRQKAPANDLIPPLGWRATVAPWNLLFFDEGPFQPRADKSPEWNRGAYLVEGAGHCGACHTPKNIAGAVKRNRRLEGGYGEDWYASELTGDLRNGLGDWSVEDIIEYLGTGSNAKSAAAGPMAEVVNNSTRYLTREDLNAIAVYLKDMPKNDGQAANVGNVDRSAYEQGHALYLDHCTGCHMENGEGLEKVFPPLKGNGIVQSRDPSTAIRLVLDGAKTVSTSVKPASFGMPSFRWKLNDEQVADLVTYIRNAWGNHASPAGARQVKEVRSNRGD